jgi:predicted TPR repeat methyltransferase
MHLLLEPDPEMVMLLAARAKEVGNARVIEGGFPYDDIHDASLAGVFMVYGTIGEINPVCVAIQELARILMPGGKALISTINPLTYKASPLGIKRSKPFVEALDLSEVSYTIPLTSLGIGEYQTHFWSRQQGRNQHFTVRQYFPTVEVWQFLIEQAGLRLLTNSEALTENGDLMLLLEKPMPTKASVTFPAVREIYNKIGENYDQFLSNAHYCVPAWIAPHFDELKGLHPRIIDMACGNGLVGRMLAERKVECSELIGYDISEVMVNECHRAGTYDRLCRLDLARGLPGVGALTTDIVTGFGFLEFVPDDALVLRDIRRVLVIGGELYCTFELTENDKEIDFVESKVGSLVLQRRKRSRASIEALLLKEGFARISTEVKQGYISPTSGQSVMYLLVRAIREHL